MQMACNVASAQSNGGQSVDEVWERFRSVVPYHMQDWVIAGDGPIFTLIYSEPPPVHNRAGYEALFQATFRGFQSFDTIQDRLGFNGRYTDIAVQLDYSFAGEDALLEFEVDLRALSTEIYGTSHGARALRLEELEEVPPGQDIGDPIQISAAELYGWLNENDMVFSAPETGISGSLKQVAQQRAGRYLSSDGSLVLLIVDHRRVDFSDVPNIRHFVLDSDLILGGVVNQSQDLTYVVGRARQLDWADFPPLRVEDVLNIISVENNALAQSYDRSTPGAGRVTYENQQQDWAPSFLSAELLNTEFGSLLNIADAVLKSQSLGGAISYVGFDITDIPNPPQSARNFQRGVWQWLSSEIELTSLIFNFNTIGSGHWYVVSDDIRVFATNRTGSYSVTYSPYGAGETSLNQEAAVIAAAEREYGAWFNTSGNLALARSVQYTSLFQVFSEPYNVTVAGYQNRDAEFAAIGEALRTSINSGFSACFPSNAVGESRFELLRDFYLRQGGDFPETRQELLQLLGEVATELRYDGNLFGSELEELGEALDAIYLQEDRAHAQFLAARNSYDAHAEHLLSTYGVVAETYPENDLLGRPVLDEFDQPVMGVRLERGGRPWRPISVEERLADDEWARRLQANNSAADYANTTTQDRVQLEASFVEFYSTYGDREALADFVAWECDLLANTNDIVFATFGDWTSQAHEDRMADTFLLTPTVVLSRDEIDPGFRGGHNVEQQGLEVRFGSDVGPDGFTLDGNQITVSRDFSGQLSAITEAMAGVRRADPDTQREVFEATVQESSVASVSRDATLEIDQSGGSEFAQDGLPVQQPDQNAPPPPDNGLRLGWGEGGMFMDQTIDGELRRSHLFGVLYGLPQLLESRLAGNRIAIVEFDLSLDAGTRDTIVENFVRERPATAAGGGGQGGDGGGRWRVAADEPDGPNRQPRMYQFHDRTTGQIRIVLETPRGRMEVVLEDPSRSDELLEALSMPIESGASFELSDVTIATDQVEGRAVITNFAVRQEVAVDGSVAGFVIRGLQSANRAIADSFSSALRRAFSRTTTDGASIGTNGDLLIEFQNSAMETGYFRRVVGRVVVDNHGMRWILHEAPNFLNPGEAVWEDHEL